MLQFQYRLNLCTGGCRYSKQISARKKARKDPTIKLLPSIFSKSNLFFEFSINNVRNLNFCHIGKIRTWDNDTS